MLDEQNRKARDVFGEHFAQIVEAIDEPLMLATTLKEKGFIGRPLYRRLQSTKGESDDEKSIAILSSIEALLSTSDDAFNHLEQIMVILDGAGPALRNITKKMRRMLGK